MKIIRIAFSVSVRSIWFIILMLMVFLLTGFDNECDAFSGGNGTASNPFQVSTFDDLKQINNDGSGYYELINDIDLNGGYLEISNFTGSFDGKGFSIKNYTLSHGINVGGLFATNNGTIKNLNLASVYIENVTPQDFGGIATYNNGIISNCTVTGKIYTSCSCVGGIAAKSYGRIIDCVCNVDMINVDTSGDVGGIVGCVQKGRIERCTSHGSILSYNNAGGVVGSINTSNYHYNDLFEIYRNIDIVVSYCGNSASITGVSAGGIVGYAYNYFTDWNVYNSVYGTVITIEYSANGGDINGFTYSGGIVGIADEKRQNVYYKAAGITINRCANVGSVLSCVKNNSYAGGICGYLYSGRSDYKGGTLRPNFTSGHTIKECFNLGEVLAIPSSQKGYAGGIVGYIDNDRISNIANISDCFNSGNINDYKEKELAYRAGGIVGSMNLANISTCYNRGNVFCSESDGQTAGIVGEVVLAGGSVKNSRYLDNNVGIANLSVTTTTDNLCDLTIDEMKDAENYNGFDFSSIWDNKTCYNSPTLRNFLIPNTYYEHDYRWITETKASLSSNGLEVFACKKCNLEKESRVIYQIYSVDLEGTEFVITGKEIEPEVTILDINGNQLVKGEDYDINFSNNSTIGKATANIVFKGKYEGEVEKNFSIVDSVQISGNIIGYSGNNLKIVLIDEKGEETVNSNNSFTFDKLKYGNYRLIVMGGGDYISHEYSFLLKSSKKQDITLYQLGDTNCDGKRSAADLTRLARHLAMINLETDSYRIKMFDTDKNNTLNAEDVTHLARYLARMISAL